MAKGLVECTDRYLTPAQGRAVVGGRYRGDGRKMDLYVSWDTLDIDLDV